MSPLHCYCSLFCLISILVLLDHIFSICDKRLHMSIIQNIRHTFVEIILNFFFVIILRIWCESNIFGYSIGVLNLLWDQSFFILTVPSRLNVLELQFWGRPLFWTKSLLGLNIFFFIFESRSQKSSVIKQLSKPKIFWKG